MNTERFVGLILVLFMVCAFFAGIWLGRKSAAHPTETRTESDTTYTTPTIRPPDPATIQAMVQAQLKDTLLQVMAKLPTYRDTNYTTITDTDWVEIPAGSQRAELDTSLGYYREDSERFVQQGRLYMTWWSEPFGLSMLRWQPTPQPLETIYTTRYEYITLPAYKNQDVYLAFFIGVVTGGFTF